MWEWNKYEIVLLIEAVKQINNGAARGTTLKKLSKKLRRMAKNRGENIGEQYRNYRGMNTKAHNIEYTVAICGTPQYERLLFEAEAMVKGKEEA